MNRKVLLVVATLVLTAMTTQAQERTVGLMINEPGAYNGYLLFNGFASPTTYLIDNEGMLVHSWSSTVIQGLGTPLLGPDGYLYRSFARPEDAPALSGIEKVDWDGNVLWHYVYGGAEYNYSLEHDFDLLPNGNILILAGELKDSLECAQAGINIDQLLNGTIFVDYLIEVQPVSDSSFNVVWEWHFWDHLIQDFDATKDNYGVVADHPELLDINSGSPKFDWPHLNTVYYNPKFEQILLCSYMTSELYIIDHSTIIEEARGHTGGTYGKGGDLLYRWGNPQLYGQGTADDQKNSIIHMGSVIPEGYPGAGNFLWLNNGATRGYSSIDEIIPPVDEQGNYLFTPPRWGPEELVWTWSAPNPADYFAPMVHAGRVQRLPNGNTSFGHPFNGKFYQVTSDGEIVWLYINPVSPNGPVHQGDKISNNGAKIHFYSPDYPGFAGKDLIPKGPIELGVEETKVVYRSDLKLYPSISSHSATISYQVALPGQVQIKLYNALGQEVRTLVDAVKPAGSYQIRWNGTDNSGQQVSAGVYFCRFHSGGTYLQKRIVLVR